MKKVKSPGTLQECENDLTSHVGVVFKRNETQLKKQLLFAKKKKESLKQQVEVMKVKSKPVEEETNREKKQV